MEKKIKAVQLMREIRLKLGKKYARSRKAELQELKEKYGHLRKKASPARSR
jgi:hypothetical protein